MQSASHRSWRVTFDAAPLVLHSALYVRDACALVVDPQVAIPPQLSEQPPRHSTRVDPDEWGAWWAAIVDDPEVDQRLRNTTWPLASPSLARQLDLEFGAAPLRWVSREIKPRHPFREGDPLSAVDDIMRRLHRENGHRSPMSVRIGGLATEGEWLYAAADRALILASWQALQHADDWLADTLRAFSITTAGD